MGLPSILHCQGELIIMLGNKECLFKTIGDQNIYFLVHSYGPLSNVILRHFFIF
jgi:hypothetical protein